MVGQIRRQCTSEYKVNPLNRKMRELVGLKFRQRFKGGEPLVEQWFGISLDELRRTRLSRHAWSIYHYPLIELKMTRDDCQQWLRARGIDAPRSACVGCPYHSDAEWRWLRDHSPEDWADACDVDRRIRKRGGMRGDIFLHRSCKPLDEVDLSTPEDYGQMSIWGDECAGMCGV